MGFSEVKKELKKFDKDKLIDLIADLYKKHQHVKEYLDFFVNPSDLLTVAKYKDKIFEAFYPKRGFTLKLKDGKQAIANLKKLEVPADMMADHMLFYVECGVKYTNDFGDINDNFYVSLAKMYVQSLTLMQKEDSLAKFQKRALQVVYDSDGIGWGFHDYLEQAYTDFYPDDIEEQDKLAPVIKLKKERLNVKP